MARKSIEGGSQMQTVFLGEDKKAGQVMEFSGFLTGCHEHEKPSQMKGKDADLFRFLHFVTEDKTDADEVAVLACGQLWASLTRNGITKKEVVGCKCWLKYKGREKVKGYAAPLHQVAVEYDDEIKLKNFDIIPI
jgi:hypothetical protein